tara:strand:- start:1311 stop:1562 length:252 start_codon:yes stop_codon:yes gene_type:complete
MKRFKVGTLLEDSGNVGMISAILPKGCETFKGYHKINWRDNYEIQYANSTVYIIGIVAFHRLVDQGQIKIIDSTSGVPPSPDK